MGNLACLSCGSNCVTCANQYACSVCESGFHKDTSGKCIQCKGNTCDAGGVANGAAAGSIYHNTRFQTSVGRTCRACISGCSVGNAQQNAWDGTCKCVNCVSTMWPWNNANPIAALAAQNSVLPTGGSCKVCDANCALCGAKDKCAVNSCNDGYTNKGVLAVCQACTVTNCKTCNADPATCTACKAAAPLLKGGGKACYSCPTVAAGHGVFNDAVAGTCVSCPTGCSGCSSASVCTACEDGYVKSGNVCAKCNIGNCKTCTLATKDTICDTCMGTYTRKTDGKSCYKCDAAAAVFSNPATGTCVSCGVSHCAACTAANTCNLCKSGYILEGGTCHACGIKHCASCAFATRNTVCAACEGKYAKQNIPNAAANSAQNKCDAVCDAHATTCGDAYTATACDTKKNYYLTGGRCVYCNLQMVVAGTAAAGKATTAGNQYLTAGGVCSTCDKDANGCASSLVPAACKTSTNTVVGGNCVASCKTYEAFGTFTGKCHSGCVSNVGTGTVNGGARDAAVGGCYSNEGMEAQLCAKGYHVQGASVGLCCDDDNSASGLVVGSVTLASVMTALYALM